MKRLSIVLCAGGLLAAAASAQHVIVPTACELTEARASSTEDGPYLQNNPPVGWWNSNGILTNAADIADGAPVPTVWPEHQYGYSALRAPRVRDTGEAPSFVDGTAELTFDLNGTVDVEGVVLWNHSEGTDTQSDRGVENAGISWSSNGVDFIFVETLTFAKGPQDGETPVSADPQYLSSPISGATHLRMAVTNFAGHVILGFSEMRVIGDRPLQPTFIADPIVKADGTFGSDYADESQTLDGSATNSAGDTISYEKVDGPDWLVVATNGALSGIVSVSGTNDFTVRAFVGTDGANATLQIVVPMVGNPPAFSTNLIAKADGKVGEDYGLKLQTLDADAVDPDGGDILTFLKEDGPAWLNVASNGALSGIVSLEGTNSFTVSVDDGNGNSDTATLLIVAGPADPAPANSLVHHWKFDDGSGTIATDSAGVFDGTILGASWTNDAVRGDFLMFDGTNDSVDPSLFLPQWTATNAETWAVWVYADANNNNDIILGNRVDGKTATANDGTRGRLFAKMTTRGDSNGRFVFNDGDPDLMNLSAAGRTDILPVDEWYHLAIVRDGADFTFYVDGVGYSNASFTASALPDVGIPFFMGGEPGAGTTEHFLGGLDDVVIYNYALAASNVVDVMNGIYNFGAVDLSNAITDYSFNPSGTSSLSFTGAVSSAYVIKSTGNLSASGFTTITPTAATTGSLAGDVITTDDSGAATVEFTETADNRFYQVESAP